MSENTEQVALPSRKELRKAQGNKSEPKNKQNYDDMDDYALLQEAIGYQMTNSRIFNYMVKKPLVVGVVAFIAALMSQIFAPDFSMWAWGATMVMAVPVVVGTVLIVLNVRKVRFLEDKRHPMLIDYLQSIKKKPEGA